MGSRAERITLVLMMIAVTAGVLSGCYYLGMHGPSIQQYPQTHDGVSEDKQCLFCHHPDHATGPPTSHPEFTGCLKCHNDAASEKMVK